jgi:hypothetical protein
VRRHSRATGLLLALTMTGCAAVMVPTAGFESISAEEAAWRQIEPQLVGMPKSTVEHCAGPPVSSAPAPAGATALVYRAQDLRNYCQVTLTVSNGRVVSVAAEHSAPEYMWLHDGSNYCGQIFLGCPR